MQFSQLETRTMPLHCDSAEFGIAPAHQSMLAVSMYQLDETTGKRNGKVAIFIAVSCEFAPVLSSLLGRGARLQAVPCWFTHKNVFISMECTGVGTAVPCGQRRHQQLDTCGWQPQVRRGVRFQVVSRGYE